MMLSETFVTSCVGVLLTLLAAQVFCAPRFHAHGGVRVGNRRVVRRALEA